MASPGLSYDVFEIRKYSCREQMSLADHLTFHICLIYHLVYVAYNKDGNNLIEGLKKTFTGCLNKKWDLFHDQYLHQIQHKSAGYIFYLKGGIHSSVWSTKAFLYHIMELRYKQNNMGNQISRILNNEQSNIF